MPGYTEEMLELRTAKSWGLTPRQWRQEPPDDRMLMMAFDTFENTCDAYRDSLRNKETENAAQREFRAMQRDKAIKKRTNE